MDTFTIGQLAGRCHVNLQTIRFYERKGLLPKARRLASGYRTFSQDSVRRVQFIKRTQELGFSLKEIKELRVNPTTTCADVRKRAETKIITIDQKIQTLRAMKKSLERLVTSCSGGGPVSECPILEGLDPQGSLQ
jgi:MerR family mercuric resistance operon transcriptional regulator